MCLQTPSRSLIDVYLVLSDVLCLIFIHHGKLLHVKCQPLDFDSSQRRPAGISQIAPWPLASCLPSFLEKPPLWLCGTQDWPLGGSLLALMGLTQSASSQVLCLGCGSLSRTAEEGDRRRLAFSGRHALGTEPASELHSLVKSAAEMCSILFTCPFRSSLHLLPFATYPRSCLPSA